MMFNKEKQEVKQKTNELIEALEELAEKQQKELETTNKKIADLKRQLEK